jgi:Leucine-rich repeat (LRR) protein
MGGRKSDDANGKTENKRKKEIKLVCTALFLNNNEIRTLKALPDTLQYVMYRPENLEWLDLSYNYLQTIDKELLDFPNLKTLYLHGNYIANLDEVRKL